VITLVAFFEDIEALQQPGGCSLAMAPIKD